MTLGAWLEIWMELYVQPAGLAPSTIACYNRAVAAVPQTLRQTPLEELSVLDIRRWLLQVAISSPRAAQLDRVMILKALRYAQKAGEAPQGRFDPEMLPKIDHKPAKAPVLDFEQMRAYMAAASASPAAVPLLLCCCGLRRGEAHGVRWENIDFRSGTLTIVGQRIGEELRKLKTDASVRSITLPDIVMAAIRKQPRQLGGWVCDLPLTQIYREHRAVLAAAQLPHVTLHGLRHSYATAAVLSGVPIKLVQGALGHAHYGLTADLYADHLPPVSAVATKIFPKIS